MCCSLLVVRVQVERRGRWGLLSSHPAIHSVRVVPALQTLSHGSLCHTTLWYPPLSGRIKNAGPWTPGQGLADPFLPPAGTPAGHASMKSSTIRCHCEYSASAHGCYHKTFGSETRYPCRIRSALARLIKCPSLDGDRTWLGATVFDE